MKYLMPLIMVCCVGCATAIPTTHTTTKIDDSLHVSLNPAKRGTCVKGERFKADCNWCTCYKDGPKQKALCTKMLCTGDWIR